METLWDFRYAQRTQRMGSSAVRELLKISSLPGVISFAGGLPAPEVFPIDKFIQASETILLEQGKVALQYSITEGYVPLREMIAQRVARYGIKVTPENILITSGSQQALDLIGKMFINRGDRILVEDPTYLGALQAWNAYGAEYVPVPMDEDGIIISELEKALRTGPKFMYILPNFQNPTGISLSVERRKKLIKLADQYGVPIIEDDPYGQLRYEGEHLPSLVGLDNKFHDNGDDGYQGNVIYLSTFSKILAPGIRLAWVIAPSEVIRELVKGKQGADLHTSIFSQMLAYQVSQDGFLEDHIKVIREAYGGKRDIMLEAMKENFPPEVKWTHPEGGLFLWVTLPEYLDARELLPLAVEKKVAFINGAPFFPGGGGHNTLRLNFSNASPENLRLGIQRLGEVFKEAIEKEKAS